MTLKTLQQKIGERFEERFLMLRSGQIISREKLCPGVIHPADTIQEIYDFYMSELEAALREFAETVRVKKRKVNDLPPDNGGLCLTYLEHNPVWDGDYYTCQRCGIEFAPANWINAALAEQEKKIKQFLGDRHPKS